MVGPLPPTSDLEHADAPTLASIEAALRAGSATIAAASIALRDAGTILREMRTNLVRAAHQRANPSAIQKIVVELQANLQTLASSAARDGVNLVCIPADAADDDDVFFISALARGASGEMTVRSVEIDRDLTALFDARPGIKRGTLDRIDARSGASVSTLDVSTLTKSPDDQVRLAHHIRQVEAAIVAIAAAGSRLSLARSRIDLQSRFIDSIADDMAGDAPQAADLDQASARDRAIETRALLGRQGLSIANLNARMILKLFQDH